MTADKNGYAMGHSDHELRRLQIQAGVLKPITRSALLKAGLSAGESVLDVGCGAGDTTMLAAEIVGPSGHVIGIDRNEAALGIARGRAAASSIGNVSFHHCSLEAFDAEHPFDAVIARYVLVHQPDPVECLKAMARFVKTGGLLFCHELSFRSYAFSHPKVPAWDDAVDGIIAAFITASPTYDAGDRLAHHFSQAGLPPPELSCEVPITADESSALCPWIVNTLQTLLPYVKPERLVSLDMDTLEQRIRSAIQAAQAQVEAPAQILGWSRIGR